MKLEIKYVPLASLNEAPWNPRKISEKNFEKLKKGIKEFGLIDPIIATREKVVVGGHQRLKAARELGMKTGPVVYIEADEQKAKVLNILLNNQDAQGEWEFSKLADLVEELNTGDFDMDLTGFDDKGLEDIATWNQPAEEKKCPECGYVLSKKKSG